MMGYKGPLCQTCSIFQDIKYSKKGQNNCNVCYSQDAEITIFVLVIVFFTCFYALIVQ